MWQVDWPAVCSGTCAVGSEEQAAKRRCALPRPVGGPQGRGELPSDLLHFDSRVFGWTQLVTERSRRKAGPCSPQGAAVRQKADQGLQCGLGSCPALFSVPCRESCVCSGGLLAPEPVVGAKQAVGDLGWRGTVPGQGGGPTVKAFPGGGVLAEET